MKKETETAGQNTIYTEEHKEIVKRLQKARKDANLTQEEAAGLWGVKPNIIIKIEIGQRRIDAVELLQLAGIYNKEITHFYDNLPTTKRAKKKKKSKATKTSPNRRGPKGRNSD